MRWVVVGAVALVCLAMRVALPLGLGDRRPPWLDRALAGAVPGLLGALVATGALAAGTRLHPDGRLAGLAAAGCAIALRAPPLLILVVAAAATALARSI